MIKCPYCGRKCSFQEAEMNEEWRQIIKLLPTFGKHGKLVFEYLENFSLNPLKAKSKKVLRLLTDMAKLFENEQFNMRKTTHKISRMGIIEGLTIVNNKHFSSPIENHNYLKKVMLRISEREEKEKSIESEKRLREKEDKIRGRRVSGGDGISAQEFMKKKGLSRLMS